MEYAVRDFVIQILTSIFGRRMPKCGCHRLIAGISEAFATLNRASEWLRGFVGRARRCASHVLFFHVWGRVEAKHGAGYRWQADEKPILDVRK